MSNGYYPAFGWTSLYQVMQQWEQFGVFTVIFPLILVFAVVFAILEKVDLFKNRGVHLLVALVIGFFTISNPYVSGFFMYFFSNLALGIIILIGLVILLGIALKPDDDTWTKIFTFAGGAIFLFVLIRSGALKILIGENFWYWFQVNSALVLIGIIVIVMIVIVLTSGFKKKGGFEVTPAPR